jgi:hypothetical protein
VSPSGELIRRTILMESPDEGSDEDAAATGQGMKIPMGTSGETLRALADLEDQRKRGEINEFEYTKRRREILAENAPPP